MIIYKSKAEIARMREAGRITALALQAMRERVRPGVTTAELNAIAEEVVLSHGATPAFKGYPPQAPNPFPATVCISINEQLVHGRPGPRPLQDGDIVSLDMGAIYQG